MEGVERANGLNLFEPTHSLMKIHIVKSEQNLEELARTLFKVEGPESAALEKRAVAELKRANPGLKPNRPAPAGEPLLVPEVPGLRRTEPSDESGSTDEETLKQMARALKGVDAALKESHGERKDADQQTLKEITAHQRGLKAAHPEAHERVTATAARLKARAKDLDQEAKLNGADLKRLAGDLDALNERVKRG